MKKSKALIMMIPGVVIICWCLFFPLLKVIVPTFTGEEYLFSRYINFFLDDYYRTIFMRTVRIALVTTLICSFLGIPTAYFISICSKKWRGILLAISIFPLMTNSVIRSFAWINILGTRGMINEMLLKIGLVDQPLKLLYSETAIIIGSTYLFLPLMIVTVTGIMENISSELMEAAQSLGTNPLKAFFKVIFPLSLPGIIVGAVLVFTGTLTAYTTPQLLGGNRNLVLATLIYQRAMTLSDWSGAAVISLIMILVTLLVIKLFNFVSVKLDQRGGKNA
jgi:putative spermidine/putrescine transport system permease protein